MITIKISSSSNVLRIIQFLILIFPLLLVILINVISDNYAVFINIGFIVFLFIYLFIVKFGISFFLLDWDLYIENDNIIFKNIFGKSEIINVKLINNIKVHKTILSMSFYFNIEIDNKQYLVRYFPKRNVYESYLSKKDTMNELENELKSRHHTRCAKSPDFEQR